MSLVHIRVIRRTVLVFGLVANASIASGCGWFALHNGHYYDAESPSPKYSGIRSRMEAQRNPRDSNLRSFDLMVRSIEQDLNVSKGPREKRWEVVPLYTGWRGEQALWPKWWNPPGLVCQQLTFWGRKNAAERVGRGELQVVLSQASAKWRGWRQGDSTRAYNQLILAGHSFGGGALLAATLPWLVADTRHVGDLSTAPADLIIALNPAIQAGVMDQKLFIQEYRSAFHSMRIINDVCYTCKGCQRS